MWRQPLLVRHAPPAALAARNAALRGTTPEEEFGGWERQIPMGRLGEPDDPSICDAVRPDLGGLLAAVREVTASG